MPDAPTTQFIDQLRDLIAAGEESRAVEQLTAFLKGIDRDYYREAIVQQSRVNDVRVRERRGTLSAADAEVQRNRIRAAVLDLLDDVERRLDRRLLPVPMSPVDVPAPAAASLEKIVGANNLKNIAWLRTGLARSRSVCRVVTPQGIGTGFVVPGERVWTNHHVIPDAATASESRLEFGYEVNEAGLLAEPVRYGLKPASLRANAELDYCVVEIDPSAAQVPLAEWGCLEFETGAVPEVGEHVTIIQHPAGGPKQIAITANQVVAVFEHRLQYTTDTLPGSSGSPVFNDDWKVVALHHAGGNLVKNAQGVKHFANEGILASTVLATLQ